MKEKIIVSLIVIFFIFQLVGKIKKKMRDISTTSFSGQKYTFLIHITLQDGQECDLVYYSDFSYKGQEKEFLFEKIKQNNNTFEEDSNTNAYKRIYDVIKMDPFDNERGSLKVIYNDEKAWVRSDSISKATIERFESGSELSNSFKSKMDESRCLRNESSEYDEFLRQLNEDTSTFFKGQKYTFVIHITLHDGQECDLIFYSNSSYKNSKHLILKEQINQSENKSDGHEKRCDVITKQPLYYDPNVLEVIYNNEKAWIRNESISKTVIERFENCPELSEYFNSKIEEIRWLRHEPSGYGEIIR